MSTGGLNQRDVSLCTVYSEWKNTNLSGGGNHRHAVIRDVDVIACESLDHAHDLEAAHGPAAVEGVHVEKVLGLGALALVANLGLGVGSG